MRFPERFRSLAVAAVAVSAIGMAAALAVPAHAAPEPDSGSTASPIGKRLLARYEATEIEDGVRLWPRDESSPIRSIEVSDDDQVLINGKEFEAEEAVDFLGRDGEPLRDLLGLDAEERRAALGLAAAVTETEGEPESDTEPEAEAGEERRDEIDVDVPIGVPGSRVKVRVTGDDRVSVGRSIHLAADESARDVVCVGCSIDVEGTAQEAVAIGGSVRVSGTVERNATAVGGSVDVAEGAVVGGDAVAVGGSVEVEEGGRVEGQNTSVGVGGPWFRGFRPGRGFHWAAFDDFSSFIAAAMRTGMLALLGVLIVLLAGPVVDRMSSRVVEEPWKAAFAGLLTQLLILPLVVLVVVVLAVSIIGIPLLLLVPFALLAFAIGWLVGFVAVARALGGWAERRFGWQASSVAMAVVVGVVLIQAASLLGRLLSMPGGVFAIVGFSLVGLGFFLKYIAWTIGLGGMTLVALSGNWRRRGGAAVPVATVPPPPPPAPLAPEMPSEEYPPV